MAHNHAHTPRHIEVLVRQLTDRFPDVKMYVDTYDEPPTYGDIRMEMSRDELTLISWSAVPDADARVHIQDFTFEHVVLDDVAELIEKVITGYFETKTTGHILPTKKIFVRANGSEYTSE